VRKKRKKRMQLATCSAEGRTRGLGDGGGKR
jgi:hypothetical protein